MKAIVTYKRGSSNPIEERMEVDFPLIPEWDDYEEQMVFYPSGLPASDIISIDVKPSTNITKEVLDKIEKNIDKALEEDFPDVKSTGKDHPLKAKMNEYFDKTSPEEIYLSMEKISKESFSTLDTAKFPEMNKITNLREPLKRVYGNKTSIVPEQLKENIEFKFGAEFTKEDLLEAYNAGLDMKLTFTAWYEEKYKKPFKDE